MKIEIEVGEPPKNCSLPFYGKTELGYFVWIISKWYEIKTSRDIGAYAIVCKKLDPLETAEKRIVELEAELKQLREAAK